MQFIEQIFDEIAEKVFEDTTGRELETIVIVLAALFAVIDIIARIGGVNIWAPLQ